MNFENPLIEGVLIKRYKRFLADVRFSTGETVVVHVPNSGSMKGVSDPGSPCRVSISPNPHRKLPHTLEMVFTRENQWVGVNTSLANKLVREAFDKKKIAAWSDYTEIAAEVKIHAHSRLDFLLAAKNKKRYVEVKNVSMALPPEAVFPDAVTERGQKHIQDLVALTEKGFDAEIFFVVQREDCRVFRACFEIDPEYAKLLETAAAGKVQVRCWSCSLSATSIEINQELKVNI